MDYLNILFMYIQITKPRAIDMAKVVIFGIQDFAQLAYFYLTHDSEHEVVAFTVHEEYLNDKVYMGLPVVPYEDIKNSHPPNVYALFAPISPRKMNKIREGIYNDLKAKGYKLISYVSSKATYFGISIGENCFILENNVIQPFAEIGNNVIMWSGNHLGHHSVIKDHNFIASHAVISGHVVIGENCFLGVNSTIGDGVVIAKSSYIGAGAILTDNSIEEGVYPGIKAELSKVPSSRLRNL
jgi:sugar O-acyltransferase (sialic acid O-acetyltransferase NeuD family)